MREIQVLMMNEEKKQVPVPFYVVESMLDRQGSTIKRLWITCILLIVLLVGTNALWIWYESQFEDIVTEQEVDQEVETDDTDGDLIITGIGNVYGKDKTENENSN